MEKIFDEKSIQKTVDRVLARKANSYMINDFNIMFSLPINTATIKSLYKVVVERFDIFNKIKPCPSLTDEKESDMLLHLLRLIIKNRKTPETIIDDIIKNTNHDIKYSILKYIAENHKFKKSLYKKIINNHMSLKKNFSKNPTTPIEIILEIAEGCTVPEKTLLCKNPGISPGYIISLLRHTKNELAINELIQNKNLKKYIRKFNLPTKNKK